LPKERHQIIISIGGGANGCSLLFDEDARNVEDYLQ